MYKKKKVIVGMSGGVDSSVSAYILKKMGFHVEGLFMKNWEEDDSKTYCNALSDLADAESVCDRLGIKLHTMNFAAEYWDKVFKKFLSGYNIGLTPNPDVLCNKEIKFKIFLDFALNDLEADYIGTGHYVRNINLNNEIQLLRGLDYNKDQSYFLYTLNKKQISKSIFPIGELKKTIVRKIANELGFINAMKKDSTGICFIGKRKFHNFISRYLPYKPGKIINHEGHEIGQHKGLIFYTIGQRKGIGIGGIKRGNGKPWYVINKDLKNNTLIVAQGKENQFLMSTGLIATKLNWINDQIFNQNINTCTVKTRYRQSDISCSVNFIDRDLIIIWFNTLINSVTPGQSAVLYKGDICLGGGIIKRNLPLKSI